MASQVIGQMDDSEQASLGLRRIALIAVLAITLGLTVQASILALRIWGGGRTIDVVVAAAGGVTWSLLVCTGVGVGTVLAQGRPLLSGLLAAAFAPEALAFAKGAQRALGGWLGATPDQAILSVGLVNLVRGVEYGLLGYLLGVIVADGHRRPWPFLRAGAFAGLVFGGTVCAMSWRLANLSGTPLSTVTLATMAINELAFPIGCALVIYLGLEVGRSLHLGGLDRSDRPLAA